jgi:hypothetical protein
MGLMPVVYEEFPKREISRASRWRKGDKKGYIGGGN